MGNLVLKELFEKLGITYQLIPHIRRETALEIARAEREHPDHVAKVVIVKARGKDLMFVIPANRKLDLFKAADFTDSRDIRVESESEIIELFQNSETGAMPPFGSLYGIPCFLDMALASQPEITFSAGTHTESFKIKTRDYLVLSRAAVGDYSVPVTRAHVHPREEKKRSRRDSA